MNSFTILQDIPVRVFDTKTDKTPIVLLHGYLETMEIWDSFFPLLNENFRVILFDLPGHGMSGSYDINTMSRQAAVIKAYLDKERITCIALAGHSMGGYVAQAFTLDYPDTVRSLVLIHSTPFSDSEEKKCMRELEISQIKAGKLQDVIERFMPLVYAPKNRKPFEEFIDEAIGAAMVHEPEGIIASLKGLMERPSYESLLLQLKCPLLFFFGTEDQFITLDRARYLFDAYPKANSIFLENSGHQGFIEEPKVVAEAIISLCS